MRSFMQDLKFGFRMIRKNPGIASLAIVALAFGIGLTTVTFSIVYGAIIQGLPFEQAEDLMHLERANPSRGINSFEVTIHDFEDWRARQTSFENIAAFRMGTVNVSGTEGRPERYSGSFIQPAAFDLLRVRPFMGRLPRPDEDHAGADPVMLIGYGVWRDRFDSDPDMIGKTLRANGEIMTIIGVMPERFEFPVLQQVWLPLRMDASTLNRGEGFTLEVFGRLNPGVSIDQAKLEFATIAAALEQEFPETNEGITTIIKPYAEEFVGEETAEILYSMLAAVSLVLLLACANVANLLLARAASRTREIAVRTALGASRARVIAQFLSEALVLALVGGVVGTGVAYLGIEWFARSVASADPPFWMEFSLNPAALGFVAAASIFSAFFAGGIPALKASGSGISEVLKDEGRGSSSLRIGRFSKVLVVTELALSVALLMVSGLMIKGVVKLSNVDMGFDQDQILTARIGLFETDYPDRDARIQFWNSLETNLRSMAGVQDVALASGLPGQGSCCRRIAVEGETYDRQQDMPLVGSVTVTPHYFDIFDIEPLQGRLLEASDLEGSLEVGVVNESFVRKYFPEGDALGRRVRSGGLESTAPWITIVGVVPDRWMDDLEEPGRRSDGMYLPLEQQTFSFMTVTIRTTGDPLALVPMLRSEVVSLDPNLPIYDVRTMTQVSADETWFFGVFGTLFTVVGAVALILASIGLYGVMSFSVANRTQEVGIRMALGAKGANVLRLILSQGLVQLTSGLVLGAALAIPVARGLEQLYFDVEPWDPAILATILGILGLTGIVATLLPANRATKVDPIEALRYE